MFGATIILERSEVEDDGERWNSVGDSRRSSYYVAPDDADSNEATADPTAASAAPIAEPTAALTAAAAGLNGGVERD